MNGTFVDNTVVGGPAHSSKKIEHGDIVLEVDGRAATNDNIFELLIGNDIPGSVVEITLSKGGPKVNLTLVQLFSATNMSSQLWNYGFFSGRGLKGKDKSHGYC